MSKLDIKRGACTLNWDTWLINLQDGTIVISERIGHTKKLDKLVCKLQELNVSKLENIPRKLKIQLMLKGVDFYFKDMKL